MSAEHVDVSSRQVLDVGSDVRVERVAAGFRFTERPAWDRTWHQLVQLT